MKAEDSQVKLSRRDGRTFVRVNGETTETPVRVAWARPLTGWGREFVLLDDKKREVAMVECMSRLDGHSREVAASELCERYIMPRIRQVLSTRTHFGVRYWDVLTDLGRRHFAVKDPSRSVLYLTDDRFVVRDTLGNSYAIESYEALDKKSRAFIDNVL
jgi:hypothetical protein